MFNKDFYPTPSDVIGKMIEPWMEGMKSDKAQILDPSAGKGNILDYIKYNCRKPERNLFAIELDNELQQIVVGKKYRFLADDFLLYSGQYHFDYIIMNPPFSAGARHLLKAWEIAKNTKIACLLNAETIDNPCTAERELLLQIIEDNGGTIEYLGDCFSSGAERATGVQVVLVRLEKRVSFDDLHFKGEKLKYVDPENTIEANLDNQVARADFIGALVDTYRAACAAAMEYCKAASRYNFYVSTFSALPHTAKEDKSSALSSDYNDMVEAINQRAWQTVFNKTNIRKLLTTGVVEKWNKFQEQQGRLEFNEKNISELFDMLIMERGNIMNDCLVHVFDKMTSYHDDNRIHPEGWKTNDAYMVNKKVVLPNCVRHGEYMPAGSRDKFKTNYDKDRLLDDIDQCMCLLTGKKMPECKWRNGQYILTDGVQTIRGALEKRFEEIGYVGAGDKFDNTTESEFFKLKFWKKGTLHFEFKDDDLWALFNQRVARGKGWLMSTSGQSFQRKRKKAA